MFAPGPIFFHSHAVLGVKLSKIIGWCPTFLVSFSPNSLALPPPLPTRSSAKSRICTCPSDFSSLYRSCRLVARLRKMSTSCYGTRVLSVFTLSMPNTGTSPCVVVYWAVSGCRTIIGYNLLFRMEKHSNARVS